MIRGIGVPVTTNYDIWKNNPEKVFGVSKDWADKHPKTHIAVVKALIRAGIQRMLVNPFLSVLLRRGEYDHLMQSLPRARLTAHRAAEAEHIGMLIKELMPELEVGAGDQHLIDAMLEVVFLIYLYRDEFAPEVFDRLIERQLDLVANTMTQA